MKDKIWIANDSLNVAQGSLTLWQRLIQWFPDIVFPTGEYVHYSELPNRLEKLARVSKPKAILRESCYFPWLNIDVPQVSFLQNNYLKCPSYSGAFLTQQIDVLNRSNFVVANTEFVKQHYKPHIQKDIVVNNIGIDTELFCPSIARHPNVLPESIIWIGASTNYPKGFDILRNIIDKTNFNFCLVFKDKTTYNHPRVRVFNKVSHLMLTTLINSCVAGLCTSRMETQHLAGLEVMSCDKPMASTNVGIYHDLKDQPWGILSDESNLISALKELMSNRDKFSPRKVLIDNKLTLEDCKTRWEKILNSFSQ